MKQFTLIAQIFLFILAAFFAYLGFRLTPGIASEEEILRATSLNQHVDQTSHKRTTQDSTVLSETERTTKSKTTKTLNDKLSKTEQTDESEITLKKELPKEKDSTEMIKYVYSTGYNYFILSVLILIMAALLPRLEDISLPGGASITLRKEVDAMKVQVNQIQENSIKVGGKLKDANKLNELKRGFARAKISDSEVITNDDPQKGRWGGKNISNNRKLTAKVIPRNNPDYFDVELQVVSTSLLHPLQGTVHFHLHDSFANPDPIVMVENGKANLKLIAVGAFTVGAEADDGDTPLELDLSTLKVVRDSFKEK